MTCIQENTAEQMFYVKKKLYIIFKIAINSSYFNIINNKLNKHTVHNKLYCEWYLPTRLCNIQYKMGPVKPIKLKYNKKLRKLWRYCLVFNSTYLFHIFRILLIYCFVLLKIMFIYL